jgi:hypothetical protein
VREHFVVPSIRSREVAGAQRPYIRGLEHFLELFDVVNSAFNVHSVSISNMGAAIVKGGGIGMSKRTDSAVCSGSQSLKMSGVLVEMMRYTSP